MARTLNSWQRRIPWATSNCRHHRQSHSSRSTWSGSPFRYRLESTTWHASISCIVTSPPGTAWSGTEWLSRSVTSVCPETSTAPTTTRYSLILLLPEILWPSGIGSRLGRKRLWVRFLAVTDINPMFIEPTITWVPSGFSGYIWLDTKIV